jgi:hypothetical protein
MSARITAKLLKPRQNTPQRDRLIAMSRDWIANQKRPDIETMRADAATRWAALVERSPCRIPIIEPTTGHAIIAMVACWHRVSPEEITGRARWTQLMEARHDAIAAVAFNCRVAGRPLRLGEIGRHFQRDHSTVFASLKQSGIASLSEPSAQSASPELPATP